MLVSSLLFFWLPLPSFHFPALFLLIITAHPSPRSSHLLPLTAPLPLVPSAHFILCHPHAQTHFLFTTFPAASYLLAASVLILSLPLIHNLFSFLSLPSCLSASSSDCSSPLSRSYVSLTHLSCLTLCPLSCRAAPCLRPPLASLCLFHAIPSYTQMHTPTLPLHQAATLCSFTQSSLPAIMVSPMDPTLPPQAHYLLCCHGISTQLTFTPTLSIPALFSKNKETHRHMQFVWFCCTSSIFDVTPFPPFL